MITCLSMIGAIVSSVEPSGGRLTNPEIWMCPNGDNVFQLLDSEKDWSSVRDQLTGLKLYIGLLRRQPMDKLQQLAELIRENDLKVMVEVGIILKPTLEGLEDWANVGGRVDYLDIDGPIRRLLGYGRGPRDPNSNRTVEQCTAELVNFMQVIRKKYPQIRFMLLTNFPNWGYRGDVSYTGPKDDPMFYGDYDQVVKTVLDAVEKAGLEFAGATVDNPYEYLTGIQKSRHLVDPGEIDWVKRVRTYEDFCRARGIPFNLIINSQEGGETSDKMFYERTLKMLDVYVQAGGKPERYIIQSWYSYPETIAPETKAYSMTALVKAAMQKLHQVK